MGRTMATDIRYSTLLTEDGEPPCNPADDCTVCALFGRQRPDESRADWLARITRNDLATPAERTLAS